MAAGKCIELDEDTKCAVENGYWCVNNGSLLCRPELDGWLVWFRRVDGSLNFKRSWYDYESGFGNPNGNYWLGLQKLHLLTGYGTKYKLRVELGSWSGKSEWAEYNNFSVGHRNTQYMLHVDGYTGNTFADSINPSYQPYQNNGQAFSTWDRDNDDWYTESCAEFYAGGGGWWYNACGNFFPTALYGKKNKMDVINMSWKFAFDNKYLALNTLVMKIRPRRDG